MVENGPDEQPKGVSLNSPPAHVNGDEEKVYPGQLPVLTWKHKLTHVTHNLPSFRLTWKEMRQLAGIGLRLGRHILEETSNGRTAVIDPMKKRIANSSQGVPLGGIGKYWKKLHR